MLKEVAENQIEIDWKQAKARKGNQNNMNLDISRTTLGIAAGIAGTIFLSYCIYFDKKRRSDPEYKKKVREREYIGISVWNYVILTAPRNSSVEEAECAKLLFDFGMCWWACLSTL